MKKLLYLTILLATFWSCKEDVEVPELKVTYATTDVSIKNGNDGSIDLTVSGGETPYQFLWSNEATTEDIDQLSAGVYQVTVSDNANQQVIESIEIFNSEIDSLSISLKATPTSAADAADGAIDLTISGGLAPYSILWSNGETTEDITDLSAGEYSVTVTDSLEQSVTATATITEPTNETISVSMDANYAQDIYYSLTDGVVKTADRLEWDIAFYTNPMTSTIMTNDGAGIKLYVYPNGDKNDWDNVDTTNMEWPAAMYNNYADTSWQNGAFDQNALGHPDYGWGYYDMNTHGVYGDSIHLIQLQDGTFKKLFIEQRDAMTNTFHIKYADIDGSNEQNAEIACGDYLDKNMIHFSFATNSIVDHEPNADSWDFMFTKYFDQSIPYNVTGVLTNNGIKVAKADSTVTDYIALDYSGVISSIGYDWKSFNMGTFQYEVDQNKVFFIKNNNNYYRLVFTTFEGSSTGNIEFRLLSY